MRLSSVFLVGGLCAATVFAADPQIGTWAINLQKSKLRDPAAWKGRRMIIESGGKDAIRLTFEQPLANGEIQRRVEKRSPKENPVNGTPGETSIARTIDDHHRRTIFMRNGKQVGTLDSTISADGKTMTNVLKGTDSKGNPVEEVRVFDKQ